MSSVKESINQQVIKDCAIYDLGVSSMFDFSSVLELCVVSTRAELLITNPQFY